MPASPAPTRTPARSRTANRLVRAASALSALAAVLAGTMSATPAAQAAPERGTTSLATRLATDTGFDERWRDFDVFEYLLDYVLREKPESPLAVLTEGEQPLTAFLPNDIAFARLLNPQDPKAQPEADVAEFIPAYLDTGEIEDILLNHVVLGTTIGGRQVRTGEARQLTTALGETFELGRTAKGRAQVAYPARDLDARVVRFGINRGNQQLGHGLGRVLPPPPRNDSGRASR